MQSQEEPKDPRGGVGEKKERAGQHHFLDAGAQSHHFLAEGRNIGPNHLHHLHGCIFPFLCPAWCRCEQLITSLQETPVSLIIIIIIKDCQKTYTCRKDSLWPRAPNSSSVRRSSGDSMSRCCPLIPCFLKAATMAASPSTPSFRKVSLTHEHTWWGS